METREKMGTECKECGSEPEESAEKRIIQSTGKCSGCIIKEETIEGTNAKICKDCGNVTYPLNTFLNEEGTEWLCNECKTKEGTEETIEWESDKQASMRITM